MASHLFVSTWCGSVLSQNTAGALMCSMGAREWVLCHDMNISRPTVVTTWYHVDILLVFLIVTSETGRMVHDGSVLCNETRDMVWAGGWWWWLVVKWASSECYSELSWVQPDRHLRWDLSVGDQASASHACVIDCLAITVLSSAHHHSWWLLYCIPMMPRKLPRE